MDTITPTPLLKQTTALSTTPWQLPSFDGSLPHRIRFQLTENCADAAPSDHTDRKGDRAGSNV